MSERDRERGREGEGENRKRSIVDSSTQKQRTFKEAIFSCWKNYQGSAFRERGHPVKVWEDFAKIWQPYFRSNEKLKRISSKFFASFVTSHDPFFRLSPLAVAPEADGKLLRCRNRLWAGLAVHGLSCFTGRRPPQGHPSNKHLELFFGTYKNYLRGEFSVDHAKQFFQ